MDVLDLNEFAFRFTRRFYPFSAFRSLLGIAGGAESPTFAELYPANGRTLHVVGVCVNRIGTTPSFAEAPDAKQARERPPAQPAELRRAAYFPGALSVTAVV